MIAFLKNFHSSYLPRVTVWFYRYNTELLEVRNALDLIKEDK